MPETIRIETDSRGIATLTLARPEKHNALSAQMIAELHAAADQLAEDDRVRAVVLAADGKSFCAGGDLRWMETQMAADADTRAAAARAIALMLNALNTLPKPVIGRIQGNAFGGGVGLASVCDAAIGVATARFGLTETRLGLIPATIGPYVIARLGAAKARSVFYSPRLFSADEAVSLGLLSKAVTEDALDAAIEAEVEPYLLAAPGAVAEAKKMTLNLGPRISPEVIEGSVEALIKRWQSEEARDGIAAFFDKRTAPWVSD